MPGWSNFAIERASRRILDWPVEADPAIDGLIVFNATIRSRLS